ncbi:MAG: S8 family serine peptidase [Promethearchaeota archaeon]
MKKTNLNIVRVLILIKLFLYVLPIIFSNYLVITPDVKNDKIIEDDIFANKKELKIQEYTSTGREDKIQSSQYDVSSMNIREDNKVEFIIQRESSEFSAETIEFFKKYDIEIYEENSFFNSSIVYISLDLITDSIENFAVEASSIPGITYAEPNFYDKVDFIPNDPLYTLLWAPPLIGMESAWDYQLGSSSVRVAVIDSGIDYTHPDLSPNYLPIGYDFVNDDNDPWDDNGHGTHCAGTIAAVINNGIGVAGMAGVSIFAEKSLNSGGTGTHEDFREACHHAVDNGADIISYSGGGTDSATKQEGVNYAIANGVMLIAAAGNDGVSTEEYPAAYPAVIGVTATDQYDNFASFSNYGTWIDVAAPGVDIHSTFPGNSYYTASGTSMATPHVSGLAALIKSEYPTYTSAEIEALIYANAVDLGDPGFDIYFGNGRINTTAIFVPREHDLDVTLEYPSDPDFGNTYHINATVTNRGINIETGVELYLYLDQTEVNSATFPSLLPGAEETIDYLWTPLEYRTYNFTSYAPPVTDEVYLLNNEVTELIKVSTLRNYIMTPGYPYTWIDASGGIELVLEDDDSSTQVLPFDFEFYDTSYPTIFLSSNGYLSFTDSTPEEYENQPIPSSDPDYRYLIAPFWDDLDPEFSGSIYVDTDSSTYWVAEWLNIYHYDEEEVGTFEIILYNTGEIIFSYYDINYIDPDGGYTCGLNYGDMSHYNSYQGLDTSTSLFSIHFALEPIGPPRPDLTDRGDSYSSFTPTRVEPGVTSFDVWCDVKNIGTKASSAFNISYYASSDTTILDSDYLLGTDTLSLIASDDYANSSWSGTFPGGVPDGTYYIGWIIDSNADVDEYNENNNVFYESSYTLLVSSTGGTPDLTDRGPTYSDFTPTTVDPAVTSFNVWCDVENIDAAASGAFIVSYYASLDTTITDTDFLIGTDIISSIPSGDYADSSWSGTFLGGMPDGTYYIGWIIDSNDDVDESNEDNNVFYETSYQLIVINKPDLTDRGNSFSSFTPTTVQPGVTSFDVWCDIENIGTGSSGSFNVSYYASLDTTITDSDYLLGNDTLSPIMPGDYADSSWSGTFPSGVPDGIYYIGWIIDSDDDVDESDENNNIFYEISYTLLSAIIYFQEDFEGGLSKWVDINGLWHLTDTGSSWPNPCHSPTHSMWFGDEISGTFETGFREFGNITSIPIDLSGATQAYLEFYHWKEVEEFDIYDFSYVYISIDGSIWHEIYHNNINLEPWDLESIDISAYCGISSVQIMFHFDTIDSAENDYRGWLVDDIQIVSTPSVISPTPGIASPVSGGGGGGGGGGDDDEEMVSLFMISVFLIGAAIAATFLIVIFIKKRGKLPERDITPPKLPPTTPKSPAETLMSQIIDKPLVSPQFCSKCSAMLEIGNKFCTQCGAEIIK